MIAERERQQRTLRDFAASKEKYTVEPLGNLPARPFYTCSKRCFDVLASLLGLVLLFPLMLSVAVAVWADLRANPIYTQRRLGRREKPFTLLKFRTMRPGAEQEGAQWACADDPRATRFGRVLRAWHIDELPQLWNILVGQMSFVGPRPERPEFYDVFDTYICGFRQRMAVVPGLTGLAQVSGDCDLPPQEKIVYDLEYIRKRSLRMDARCLWKTAAMLLRRREA